MVSPTEKDIDRWAEMLDTPDIVDKNTYDNEWDKYFDRKPLIKNRDDLKEKTFRKLTKLRPDISKEKKVKIKASVSAKKERELKHTARIKKKIVRAEETTVTVRGRRVVRYRDRFGRFASIKKQKK